MEQKIKILYLITKGSFGGAQRYVFDLATNLSKESFEVFVACGAGRELEERLKEKYVPTTILKNSQRNINPIKEFLLFFEILKKLKKIKPDIVHLNSSKIGFLGALTARLYNIARKKKLKIIFTAHGWASNEKKGWLQRLIIFKLQWLTVILSHKTIAVSEKTKIDIARLPFIKGKIVVIHNGIRGIDFLTREKARETLGEFNKSLKKALSKNPELTIVGTISELHKNKGLDLAIEALKSLNAFFVIIGEGEEREKLEKQIRDEKLEEKIALLGHVKEASIYLKAFDIFTLTSRTEALPYAILEAGRAELPVVASSVGGVPEIIDDRKSGLLVKAEDAYSIQSVLNSLLAETEKRKLLGERLSKKIASEFSFEKMLEETVAIYRKL